MIPVCPIPSNHCLPRLQPTRSLLSHEQDGALAGTGAAAAIALSAATLLHHEVDEELCANGGDVGDEERAVDLRRDLGRGVVFHHGVPVGPLAAVDAHLVVEDGPRDIWQRELEESFG